MTVYILLSEEKGGVYATSTEDGIKVVQMFEDSDDAERFRLWLEADGKDEDLVVQETDRESVISNCQMYGYRYSIIKPHEFIIPK